METVKNTTKKGQRFIYAYENSCNYELSDCYGRCSWEKQRAEKWCIEQMKKENGDGFKILSFNTFGFSCGWMVAGGLRVETPQKSYFITFVQ